MHSFKTTLIQILGNKFSVTTELYVTTLLMFSPLEEKKNLVQKTPNILERDLCTWLEKNYESAASKR